MKDMGNGIFYITNFYFNHKDLKQAVLKECDKEIFLDEEDKSMSRKNMNKAGYFLVKKDSNLFSILSDLNKLIQTKLENLFKKKYISQWHGTDYSGVIGLYPVNGFSLDHRDKIHESEEYYSYSAVYYLNDGYEGGDLFFPEKNLRISPEENSLVFLPSDLIHRSEKVKKGEKIISPTFFKEV